MSTDHVHDDACGGCPGLKNRRGARLPRALDVGGAPRGDLTQAAVMRQT